MVHYHMCLPQPLNEGEDIKYVNDECWLTQNIKPLLTITNVKNVDLVMAID